MSMNKKAKIALCALAGCILLAADTWATYWIVSRQPERAGSAPAYSAAQGDPLSQFRTEREQLRARQEAQLNDIIHAEGADERDASLARGQLMEMLEYAREETTLEGLLRGRGFEDALVSVSRSSANVLVKGEPLNQRETAVILELVMRETGLTGGNVKIIPVK